jgi:hypothetical protein
MPPAEFFGHGHALACSDFASAFRSYGEGHEVLLLRPRATAAAGWSAVAVALVALVVVHSRFTYVKL